MALGWQAEFFAPILLPSGICSAPRDFLNLCARTAIPAHSAEKPERRD